MNNEVENVVEETVNVVTDTAKEGLSIGGAVIGGLAVTGAAAILGFSIWAGKKLVSKLSKKNEPKPEPLADEDMEHENGTELEDEEE